jgi:hypothetical protein
MGNWTQTPDRQSLTGFRPRFGDLSSIIVTNWAEFEPVIANMEWAKAALNTLEKSRNIIMHGGVLAKEDIERIGMNIRDWVRQTG